MIMGPFGKKETAPDCGTCDGSGRVQTGSSKWSGAKFGTCPSCGGTGTK
jgi:DnaJ-class molecular chaperone